MWWAISYSIQDEYVPGTSYLVYLFISPINDSIYRRIAYWMWPTRTVDSSNAEKIVDSFMFRIFTS